MTDLAPRQLDATPAVYDAAPHTKRSYANDWKLWEEFHDWLAGQLGAASLPAA